MAEKPSRFTFLFCENAGSCAKFTVGWEPGIGPGLSADNESPVKKHFMDTTAETKSSGLQTLPGDDVRQIMWRFADRYDLQMLVQSARAVARGPVARAGGRRRAQHPRMDARQKTICCKHYDESRHHRRLHGTRRRRVHRRAEESRAGADGVRTVLGGRRRGHRQPGGQSRAGADSRARHAGADAPIT